MISLSGLLAAAEAAAAKIYHQVVATGQGVTNWTSSPEVAPLVSGAVTIANNLLARSGVPAALLNVVESDIHSALGAIAAADPTVQSGGGAIGALVNVAGSVAALVPGAAPIVAGVEAAVGVAEGLAGALADAIEPASGGAKPAPAS